MSFRALPATMPALIERAIVHVKPLDAVPIYIQAKEYVTILLHWPSDLVFCITRCSMSRVMKKTAFSICERRSSAARLPSSWSKPFFRYIDIVKSLFFLNPKFQASRHLLWLYIPVRVGPGRKPWRQIFSWRGSNISICMYHSHYHFAKQLSKQGFTVEMWGPTATDKHKDYR